MGKKTKFKDDEMYIKENDIDAIRRRPSMWISSVGEAGVFHLCKEIIDNNRDECFKKESPGDEINVVITKDRLVTRDNGRGIATNLLREIFETTQAGSNMLRAGGATSGENGVGTTCAVALSSELIVTTIRPNEKLKLTLTYKESELVDEKLEEYTGDDHGLIVSFKPSKKVLGVDKIPVDMLLNWIRDFNYTLPANIKMNYTIEGKSYQVNHKTLIDYLKESFDSEKCLTPFMSFKCNGTLKETVLDVEYQRHFDIDVAITYTDPDQYKGEDIRQSWMNMIHTVDGGSHIDGVIGGFSKYMTEVICKKNKKYENQDFRKDILAHLSVVVCGMCDCATMFSAQSKHQVLLKSLGMAINKAVYQALDKDVSSSLINAFAEAILGNHRARLAGEQARNINSMTRVKKQWSTPASFIPHSSVKSDFPKELFMVEGNSAGGGLEGARDSRYQAILFFKGKPLSPYNVSPINILASDSWKNLPQVLGCGFGDTFDMKKLKFDKIIICTDADIDGDHMRCIFCAGIFILYPEIIYSGKLYIAEPPLYKLVRGKEVKYVATQNEYIEECIRSISDLKVYFPEKKMNVPIKEFITDAFDYLNDLVSCSINRSVNRYLLEYIAFGLVKYQTIPHFIKHIDKWLKMMASVYKEIGFDHDTNQVTATIDLIDQFVMIDEDLLSELMNVVKLQSKYGFMIHYESSKKNLNSTEELSHFFEHIESLYPQIKGRYKGLGSSDPEVLREVVMDPRVRRIYRVTVDDALSYAAMYDKLGTLMGSSKENLNQRKEMLMNFKFTKADIDS